MEQTAVEFSDNNFSYCFWDDIETDQILMKINIKRGNIKESWFRIIPFKELKFSREWGYFDSTKEVLEFIKSEFNKKNYNVNYEKENTITITFILDIDDGERTKRILLPEIALFKKENINQNHNIKIQTYHNEITIAKVENKYEYESEIDNSIKLINLKKKGKLRRKQIKKRHIKEHYNKDNNLRKPKKPVAFFRHERAKELREAGIYSFQKQNLISQEWNNLPINKKKKYYKMSNDDKIKNFNCTEQIPIENPIIYFSFIKFFNEKTRENKKNGIVNNDLIREEWKNMKVKDKLKYQSFQQIKIRLRNK